MAMHQHGERPYDWVGALSERRAQLSPERVGLVDADAGESYTYADLDRRANRAARLLRQQGVGEGDRVAAVSRNCVPLVDLYFATAKLGAILAPVSHRLAPRELTALLNDIEPTVLVGETPFRADLAAGLSHEEGTFERPSLIGVPDADGGSADDEYDWASYADARPANDAGVDGPAVALSDPHLFLHTGGSTGLPKEVVLTHGGILWNAFNTILSWGLRPDDVTPMVFPMFHTGGWNVLTIPLFHIGGTVIISREVDAEAVLAQIEAHDATVLVGVPAVLRFMVEADAWASTDLSSIRFAKSGGGPCREGIIDAWSDRGIDLSQGYGLTECGPNNFAMPDDWDRSKTDSIGMPGLYVDGRIVDDDGEPLPPGEIGELELASPHAGDRYWRNPRETESTFGGEWISTGDLARVDEAGYYFIEGRKKNMFVSGGENVYPPEVEDVVTDHPKVREAIVVPVADDTWGEVGKAVVEGDESLTLEDLQSFLDGRIASFKIPKHLAFVDEMPIGGAGKIERQAIEDRFGGEAPDEC